MSGSQVSISDEDNHLQRQRSDGLHLSLDDITDGWWCWAISNDDIYMSPKLKALFGYQDSELENSFEAWKSIIYPEDFERAIIALEAHIKYGTAYYLAARYHHKNGSTVWVICRGHSEIAPDGTKARIIGTHTDITPFKDSEYRLNITANYDSLTRLPNRHFFMSTLSKVVENAKVNRQSMAVLFIDIDNFKNINDSFSHKFGDEVLALVSQKMMSVTRPSDFVARLGGDEFGVIIEVVNSDDEVRDACSRYICALREPLKVSQIEIKTSASIGAACYPLAGDAGEKLIQHADMAMYSAKNSGKDGYAYFTEELGAKLTRKNQLRSGLQTALDRNELCLEYQPIIGLSHHKLVGVEALLRWKNPVLGNVMPGEFIPIAEENATIIDIGQWVLDRACQDFAKLIQNKNQHKLVLSVNVSVRQLCQVGFSDMLVRTLQRYRLEANQLLIEITETAVMQQPEQTAAALVKLSRLGVKFALDDFGVEYSSLKYLKNLPVTTLKIDQSFMENIDTNVYNVAIVKAVIALASSLGLDIIAEGVTGVDAVNFLQSLGCEMAQGYYFSKSLSCDKLLSYIEKEKLNCNEEVLV